MKRLFDLLFALVLIIPCGLLFVFVAGLIFLISPGPVLHWSSRVGRNNNLFKMPKFRTMRLDTPQVATHLLKSEDYLIPLGSLIRKLSLDEVPQLWSILTGDMSLVGPRPALFNQEDLVEARTKLGVEKLTPGITGWAQINGRDEISIPEKVKLDHEYLERKSFFFDLKIIFLTFGKVLGQKNVSH